MKNSILFIAILCLSSITDHAKELSRLKRQGCTNGFFGYVCNGGPCYVNGVICPDDYECVRECCCIPPKLINVTVPVWQWPNGRYAGTKYPGNDCCNAGPCEVNGAACTGDYICINGCCCLVPKLVNVSIPVWRFPGAVNISVPAWQWQVPWLGR